MRASDGQDMAKKNDKLATIRERTKQAMEADSKNRRNAMTDLKFVNVPDEQWEPATKTERGDRPCYEFNKIRVTIKRVVNDIRANRPSGKVRGVEDTDKDTAEIYEGLIRNIWNVSDGDTIIDAAGEYQVGAGMGAWRVSVGYASDSVFDQDIKVEGIRNPFCLYPDPACHDTLHRDARYWILTDRISKSAYEARWPKADVSDFESDLEFDDDDEEEWIDEDSVRIVEYWYKEPTKKTIHLLANGNVVDSADEESMSVAKEQNIPIVRSRDVVCDQIKMCIASGKAILEEADWAGDQFPFIIVYGECLIIDGKKNWFGLTRFAKDAQRAYNYSRTLACETIALAPQAKWWTTPTQAQGNTDKWAEAHKKNYPFLVYNPDPQAPGAPQRMQGAEVPMALIQEMQIASEDIKQTTGIFDASLGRQSNETSGVAIRARQEQGEIAVFNYRDNMAKGVQRTWEILIGLIPKIYDTARTVRILGIDGAEKYAEINKPDPSGAVINDLSRGKYDVTVTAGPSYSTQRQEASETYWKFANSNPALFGVVGDLIFKATDLPYAEQIANRLKLMLPPQIQQSEAEGKPLPPEVMQAMQQAEQAMQQVQQMGQQVQEQGAQAEQDSQEAASAKSEVEVAISNLKVQQAMMEAKHQQIIADITKREAQLMMKQAQDGSDESGKEVQSDRDALSSQVTDALAQLQQQAAQFMTQAAGVITQMQMQAQPQVVVADPPKNKVVRVKRINGELVGTIEESI
jgi:aminoglycoside N3'-acetyltransferase